MSTQAPSMEERMVFRKTNARTGRNITVTPGNSTNRHLAYGRIILDASTPSASFANHDRETCFICLSGSAELKTVGEKFRLGQYDAIYIPRDSEIEVTTDGKVDLAEFSAEVEHRYPLHYVHYAEVTKDPTLKFSTGAHGQQRHSNILIGKHVRA